MTTQDPNCSTPNEATAGSTTFHWRDGIQSFFDVDGITIEFWASSWTGKEEVRIEGALVSSLRSWRYRSHHAFEHAGHHYEVLMNCLSLATGTFRITLVRDGVEVDSDVGSYNKHAVLGPDGEIVWKKAWKKMLPTFLISGLLGAAFGYALASWLL